MKERPILFSGEMVRAILEGRKTQTRRVIKPQPPAGNYRYDGVGDVEKDEDADPECHWLEVLDEHGEYDERYWKAGKCPYGVPGERLWVRETWAHIPDTTPGDSHYKASSTSADLQWFLENNWKWRPSIHMPRSASRITLEIIGVRAERLQNISDEDAKAEGVPIASGWNADDSIYGRNYCGKFSNLWDPLAKPGAKWADNPWVWVIEFRRAENA